MWTVLDILDGYFFDKSVLTNESNIQYTAVIIVFTSMDVIVNWPL